MKQSEELNIILDVLKKTADANEKEVLDFTLDDLYNGLVKIRNKSYMKPFLKVKISKLLKAKQYLQKLSDFLGIAGMVLKPVYYVPTFFIKKLGGEKWINKKAKTFIIRHLAKAVAEELYQNKKVIESK